MSILLALTPSIDYCSILVTFEIGKYESDMFFSPRLFWIFRGPLQFHINLRIGTSISEKKKAVGIFIEITLILFRLF